MHQKQLHEIVLSDGRKIRKGDILRLLGDCPHVHPIKFLRDRHYSYNSIKIRPCNEVGDFLDAPLVLTGFEDEIEYFIENDYQYVIYTKHLKFSSLRNDLFEFDDKRHLDPSERKSFEKLIMFLQEQDQNFTMGLITSIDKNSSAFYEISEFYRRKYENRYKDEPLSEDDKIQENQIIERFQGTWQNLLDNIQFQEDNVGFLFEKSSEVKTENLLGKNLIREFIVRGYSKKFRAHNTFSGLTLSRAKQYAKTQKCLSILTILIVYHKHELKYNNNYIDPKYRYQVKKWSDNKETNYYFEKLFGDPKFEAMLEELANQPIC